MSFKGYWFNMSGAYNTYKMNHCYVGVNGIKGISWGLFGKPRDAEHDITWGFFGGGEVVHNNINYSTLSTSFSIEDDWHKLSPTARYINQAILYDKNGHQLTSPKYHITVFYKLIFPIDFTVKKLWARQTAATAESDLIELANEINKPAILSYYSGNNLTYKGILVGDNPTGALALPTSQQLGYDPDLPEGTSIGQVQQPYAFATSGNSGNPNVYRGTYDGQSGMSVFLGTNNGANQGDTCMLTGFNRNVLGNVTYSIDDSIVKMGVPFIQLGTNRFLLPKLFEGFILIAPKSFIGFIPTANLPDIAALYMCLGVEPI